MMQDEHRRRERDTRDIDEAMNKSAIQTSGNTYDLTSAQLARQMIKRERNEDTDNELRRTPKRPLQYRESASVSPVSSLVAFVESSAGSYSSSASYTALNTLHSELYDSPGHESGLVSPSSSGVEDPFTSDADSSPV
jgi:hypothetical protein